MSKISIQLNATLINAGFARRMKELAKSVHISLIQHKTLYPMSNSMMFSGAPIAMSGYIHGATGKMHGEPTHSEMKIDHTLPVEKRFEDAEEAAFWLEEQGYNIKEGKIQRGQSKYSVDKHEREVLVWLTDEGYFEWAGSAEDLSGITPYTRPSNMDLLSQYHNQKVAFDPYADQRNDYLSVKKNRRDY